MDSIDYVCYCCAAVIANADESSCRDYYGHTHPAVEGHWVLLDMDTVWDDIRCAGCGEEFGYSEYLPAERLS